jgi:hypothetical protein
MSAIGDPGGALLGLLDSVGDDKLRQVVRLVEATGQRPTLEPALAAMRPRLRQLRPPRPLTLSRLLTVPFEAALVVETSAHISFTVCRDRLGRWQGEAMDGLPPAVRERARSATLGHGADDQGVILAAGRDLWPAAARSLAAGAVSDEEPAIAGERHRVVDLLAIGPVLVPLLGRLLPLAVELDAEERLALEESLALAAAGPGDRLGVVASILLRGTAQPWAMARPLVEAAPAGHRDRLRGLVEQLLGEHRRELQRRVAALAGATEVPLAELAATLWQVAEALDAPDTSAADAGAGRGDMQALRSQAAETAATHYSSAIETVVAPLPPPGAAERGAAVRAREETARRLARLGRAARRLAAETPIHRVTEAAVERLVDVDAARRGTGQPLVDVDDARLIEILAGPDLAWRYLRPDGPSDRSQRDRRGTRLAGPG